MCSHGKKNLEGSKLTNRSVKHTRFHTIKLILLFASAQAAQIHPILAQLQVKLYIAFQILFSYISKARLSFYYKHIIQKHLSNF